MAFSNVRGVRRSNIAAAVVPISALKSLASWIIVPLYGTDDFVRTMIPRVYYP